MKLLRAALCHSLPSGPLPERIPLLPLPDGKGRVRGADGRTWTLPPAAELVAAFNRPLPLDFNHSTELAAPKGGPSPAAGWITALEPGSGGDDAYLYGRVEWTPAGETAVNNREYRFFSPVFLHSKGAEQRIARITSAALHNQPNFDLALNSAFASADDEDVPMKKILAALGLKEDTSEDDAVTAINALQSEKQTALNAAQAQPSLDKFVPRADHDAALERATNAEQALADERKKQTDAEIDAEIDAALQAGKITPATKDYHRAACQREGGLAEFRKYVESAPTVADGGAKPPPDPGKSGELTDAQRALCAQMGISEEDYQKSLAAVTGTAAA
ncbi:phage protease [Algiphilus sp.]|uniref:phage protease n=2 Tax=Algiphilus sp. TaxID=1872431 RepID=UPI0025C55159|nr:phage protease [Algiphilus sp.]MCK5772038.1 hypothetical protein [Algiphilus sp.]